jgi:hypothetical protein
MFCGTGVELGQYTDTNKSDWREIGLDHCTGTNKSKWRGDGSLYCHKQTSQIVSQVSTGAS